MLNYKLVVERTLHVETPRGLALLSVGDEVFLKLHGYGWLFGTIIALGHDTMLVAGHDLDESKRVAYRWITDVRDTAPDGETWNKVGDPFPFPVIHTDYFRTPTRSQSDDGPRRYRHSAGAQQERKREKKKGRNGAPRRNRLTKAQPGTYPTTKRRRKRAYDTKMRRMWERI